MDLPKETRAEMIRAGADVEDANRGGLRSDSSVLIPTEWRQRDGQMMTCRS